MALRIISTVDQALDALRAAGSTGLSSDTRRLRAGEAFVAWPGLAVDPRRFVGAALQAGAPLCLVDADGVEAFGFDDARIVAMPGLKAATGEIAHTFFGAPSEQLDVIAVTGTNGKTSTAWWTAQLLSASGLPCGLIGTLGQGRPFDAAGRLTGAVTPTGFTTPDPVTLHALLREMADAGCRACAIEASSIGIDEHRLAGLHVRVAQFTNFTRDHLDYHGTMDSYWEAKRALFDWQGLRAAVVHVQDERGAELAVELAGGAIDVWTHAVGEASGSAVRLRARKVHYESGGLAFDVVEAATSLAVRTPLIGQFNVANLLGVIGAARALGVELAALAPLCAQLAPVPGRMESVAVDGAAGPLAVVDYAHTPDALDQALRALRPLVQARGGKLWCVFGCGGNRDATKRPLMGAIAQQQADRVVLTSDNPRDEQACFILSQILAGVAGHDEVDVIEDRAEAIAYALAAAATADLVLIAGKGHEATQEIAGRKTPFSDVEHARTALKARAAK